VEEEAEVSLGAAVVEALSRSLSSSSSSSSSSELPQLFDCAFAFFGVFDVAAEEVSSLVPSTRFNFDFNCPKCAGR
jgi:hypothetical protein